MNTRIFLDHEPVADGGAYVRATLFVAGGAARNVHVAVWPGRHAEFLQMTHPYPSRCAGELLTIEVGDVYDVDRVRLRMDALVSPPEADDDVDVGRIVVFAQVLTPARASLPGGGMELRAVTLPIRLSDRHGCRVRPHVRTIPCSIDRSSPLGPTIELPLEDTHWAV